MGRLVAISGRQAVGAFGRIGYTWERTRGSHAILSRPGHLSLVIPLHRMVAPFLLRSQIRRAGLTEEQFLTLLT